jgi:hypothetical protein
LIFDFFFKSIKKIGVPFKIEKITGTLHEGLSKFMIIFRRILIRTRNVSDEMCRERQNTHFVFSNVFPKIVGETMWKNMAEPDRPQMTVHYDACALHGG